LLAQNKILGCPAKIHSFIGAASARVLELQKIKN